MGCHVRAKVEVSADEVAVGCGAPHTDATTAAPQQRGCVPDRAPPP